MEVLLKISRLIDALNDRVGRGVYWLILIMVLISAANAISRKAFNFSSNAFLEIQWYLFAALFMLAAGYTLLRNEHVRVDVIASKLSPKGQVWIDIFGTIFFLLPFSLIMLYYAWPYFSISFANQEWSSNPGGLIVWPVKLMLPLGFLLLLLQAVSHLIKLIGALQGKVELSALIKHHSVAEDEVETMLGEQKKQ